MRYDDVDADEAVDLIATLPRGSAYVRAVRPDLAWSEQREGIADLQDTVWQVAYALRGVAGDPHRVTRPADVVARREASAKAGSVRQAIEGGEWAPMEEMG